MNFRQSRFLSLLTCAVLVACPSIHHAVGQEQRFADANCAVTLPPDWEDLTPTRDKPEPVVAAFGTPDQHHNLMVMIYGHGKSSDPLDSWFVINVDHQCAARSSAGLKVAGRIVQVAGFRAYERRGRLISDGHRVSTLVRAIPTGEGMYFLEAAVFDGEIDDAPDVQQALASFRFLHRPPASKARSVGNWIGLQPGFYGIMALMVFVLIAGILFIVSICLRLSRHFRAATYAPHLSAEGEPPPLPPAPDATPPGPYDY